MTKRPWTEGPLTIFPTLANTGGYYIAKAETNGDIIAKVAREADAQLFAAAPLLYEALENLGNRVNCSIPDGPHFLRGAINDAKAALRAANPDAFDAPTESEGK